MELAIFVQLILIALQSVGQVPIKMAAAGTVYSPMNPKKLAGLSVMDAARTICPGT
jgi:hypothetical protein